MTDIRYKHLGKDRLSDIRPLWDKLNRHHARVSSHFTDRYRAFTFEARMKKFEDEGVDVRLDVAEDEETGRLVGYCLSSIGDDGQGEIDSIFVDIDYRGQGIGSTLVRSAIAWMEENNIDKRTLTVVHGNDSVLDFYERFGFFPARYILFHRPEE